MYGKRAFFLRALSDEQIVAWNFFLAGEVISRVKSITETMEDQEEAKRWLSDTRKEVLTLEWNDELGLELALTVRGIGYVFYLSLSGSDCGEIITHTDESETIKSVSLKECVFIAETHAKEIWDLLIRQDIMQIVDDDSVAPTQSKDATPGNELGGMSSTPPSQDTTKD